RTGEIATWNKAKLKNEVRKLKEQNFDLSKFNFNFKSDYKPFAAERLRTDGNYNLDICSRANTSGKFEMPTLKGEKYVPESLIPFNYAKTVADFDCGIHFFIDDYQFERLWNKPNAYLELLKKFKCVLTCDFSLYLDMPLPMQQWNVYRARALGHYWQENGIKVIPTLTWSDKSSYNFAFADLPKGVYATSTVGVKKDENARKLWCAGMKQALKRVEITHLVLYGGNIGFNFGDLPITEIKANTMAVRK
ncbi:MAG: DUF4417 domain-containing protein, partial [Clostridia bacterium]|nr:DUF4417 domain-containing protein [Clostridia bacterium]